ncbi:MAG: ABC transporter permease subunit [Candidatus Asgardarchaeia archaeon]
MSMNKNVRLLIIWNLRRYFLTVRMGLIIVFIILPLFFALGLTFEITSISQLTQQELIERVQNSFIDGFSSALILFFLIPLLPALSFSYLMENNEIEIYLTYPINRKEFFVSNIIVDLFILVFSRLCSVALFILIIYLKMGIMISANSILVVLIISLFDFLMIYSVALLVSILIRSLFGSFVTLALLLWVWSQQTISLFVHSSKELMYFTSFTWQGSMMIKKPLKYLIVYHRPLSEILPYQLTLMNNYIFTFLLIIITCVLVSYWHFSKKDI